LALFHYGPRNVEQARALDRQIQQMPDLPGMAEPHNVTDRYLYLDCAASWLREVEGGRNPLDKVVCRAIIDPVLTNWDEVFRVGNTWYDNLSGAARKPEWTERKDALSRVEQELHAMSDRDKIASRFNKEFPKSPRRAMGRVVAEKIMSLTAPNISTWPESEVTTVSQMLRIASAINVYRAEHGAYPAQLADLTPKYLATTPVDIFHGAAFRYRWQSDGYVLYSMGPNGTDDGGLSHFLLFYQAPSDKTKDGDDIAITVPPKPVQ
jgi:hypothetical protein